MPKVSIIVPIYNVMDQLQRCLDSIANQTFENFEVILLNDGSTDESASVAKKICQNNSKFTYTEHENMGLGPTRNKGIELATGEYLMFVDSDDFLELDAIQTLYESISSKNSDISCGNFKFYFDDKKLNFVNGNIKKEDYINLENMSLEDFSKKYYLSRVYSYSAWDKMYRKEFITNNNIVFGDNKKIFAEDNYFQLQIILNKPTISFTDKVIYNYYQRSNSIMNTFKPNLIERQINMIALLDEENKNNRDDFFTYILAPLTLETIIMEAINMKDDPNRITKYKISMEKLRSYYLFNEAIKNMLRYKVYSLYSGFNKKLFIYTISYLEKKKFVNLSDKIVTKVYFK
ncbi:glycosyltransferase [Aerococcus sp. 1KP-2016]|uniref:glycosyltransferase family 2 protein n=1 Tax=Aerococcus sp. 1KP-2016 TaxID=1981982 RepID=UPI000B983B0F|nr:glycosyltransferase [Aerococcus sp. 1KP-2016]OYQ64846.1 hypothetical protein B9P78_09275 [Aerococcus sp. 1KP-2016]